MATNAQRPLVHHRPALHQWLAKFSLPSAAADNAGLLLQLCEVAAERDALRKRVQELEAKIASARNHAYAVDTSEQPMSKCASEPFLQTPSREADAMKSEIPACVAGLPTPLPATMVSHAKANADFDPSGYGPITSEFIRETFWSANQTVKKTPIGCMRTS